MLFKFLSKKIFICSRCSLRTTLWRNSRGFQVRDGTIQQQFEPNSSRFPTVRRRNQHGRCFQAIPTEWVHFYTFTPYFCKYSTTAFLLFLWRRNDTRLNNTLLDIRKYTDHVCWRKIILSEFLWLTRSLP